MSEASPDTPENPVSRQVDKSIYTVTVLLHLTSADISVINPVLCLSVRGDPAAPLQPLTSWASRVCLLQSSASSLHTARKLTETTDQDGTCAPAPLTCSIYFLHVDCRMRRVVFHYLRASVWCTNPAGGWLFLDWWRVWTLRSWNSSQTFLVEAETRWVFNVWSASWCDDWVLILWHLDVVVFSGFILKCWITLILLVMCGN